MQGSNVTTSKKNLVIVAGVGALAAAGWVGSGVYAGLQAERSLQALAQSRPTGAFRLSNLAHERGLLRSRGSATVSLQPGCGAPEGADEALQMRVEYELSHLPLPQAAVRAAWKAAPAGPGAPELQGLLGAGNGLSGDGAVGLDGAWRTTMQLPAISTQQAGQSLQIDPSSGSLSLNGQALQFRWNLARAVVRGGGEAVDLKDLAVDLDLKNRHLGTGTIALRVGTVGAGFGTLEGLELRADAAEHADRLDLSLTPSVRQISAMGRTARDVALELSVKGVDTRSVETLSRTFEDSCGFENLTAQEAMAVREAALTLLARGLSVGIPRLAAKADGGSLEGQFMVELSASPQGRDLALARQLKSSGKLSLTGALVTPEQRQMAVGMGFAVAEGEALKASFDYADGLLKVNGRTLDASAFQHALAQADGQVKTALAAFGAKDLARTKHPATPAPAEAPAPTPEAPPIAPVAPTTTPVPAVEPAVAAAPAAAEALSACASVRDCLAASLEAARREDVDAVRRVATQIDALPKPDLGNKAVARKLNDAALAVLRGGDAAAAVPQFRQALQENPRDVEVAGNLGFALVRAGQPALATDVLRDALVLDPRRSSTWTPLAEALALSGREAEAQSALWVAFQWSGNRDKSIAFYAERAEKETQPALAALYRNMAQWVQGGARPALLAGR